MTAHYLCGELGTRLAQLEAATDSPQSHWHDSVHHLRLEAESTPPGALPAVDERAFDVVDTMCWQALVRGELTQITAVASLAAELYDFTECADLLN